MDLNWFHVVELKERLCLELLWILHLIYYIHLKRSIWLTCFFC